MDETRKWSQTYKIGISNQLAYKLNFFLQAIGPTIVFFLIRYNLWASLFALDEIDRIQGYSLSGMLEYQCWVLVVMLLSQSYSSRNLAEDIRLGRISSYLLYPFEFWKFHASNCAAYFSIQTAIALLSLSVFLASGFIASFDPVQALTAFLFVVNVSALWFAVFYTLGLLAFWLDETWTLRVIFVIIANFLSGSALPLELFPETAQQILQFLPFPYMTWAPVKIFMGTYSGSLLFAWLILFSWLLIFTLIASIVWRLGMRRYSAAGI